MKPTATPPDEASADPQSVGRDADVIRLRDLLDPPEAQTAPTVKVWSGEADGKVKEFGGRQNGLDPTRYGDWEKNGRCIDF